MNLRFLRSMAIATILVITLAGCSLFVRVADEERSNGAQASIQQSSQNPFQVKQLAKWGTSPN